MQHQHISFLLALVGVLASTSVATDIQPRNLASALDDQASHIIKLASLQQKSRDSASFSAEAYTLHKQLLNQQQQQQITAKETPSQAMNNFFDKMFDLPDCVTPGGLFLSSNLMTMFWSGNGVGKYYSCTDDSDNEYCNLNWMIMCAEKPTTTSGKTSSNVTSWHKYPRRSLMCNGAMGSDSNAVCYNKTMCGGEQNFTRSLMDWSLRNEFASKLIMFPLCYAIEVAEHYPGQTEIPGCDPNHSYLYAEPWCNAKHPLGLNHEDDDGTNVFRGFIFASFGFAGLATLIGFIRRSVKTLREDLCSDGTSSSDKNSSSDQKERQPLLPPAATTTTTAAASPAASGISLVEINNNEAKNSSTRNADDDDDESSNSCLTTTIMPHVAGILDSYDLYSGVCEFLTPLARPSATSFFDGLKTVSMTLIVAVHSLYVPLQDGASYLNLTQLEAFITTYWQSVPLLPALVCVDIFFFLSAFLAYNSVMNQLLRTLGPAKIDTSKPQQQQHVKTAIPMLIMAYINRYLRLTPTMIVVIAITAFILPTFAQGPRSQIITENAELTGCKENLWKAALYVQNLEDPDVYRCLSWTWFLMVDMQLFIFVPVFAMCVYCFKRFTELSEWLLVAFVSALVVIFYAIGVWQHPLTNAFIESDGTKVKTYFRAVDRATPYIFGILTALLGAMPSVTTFIKNSKRFFWLLQIVAIVVFLVAWNLVWKMLKTLYQLGTLTGDNPLQYGGHAAFLLLGLALMCLTLSALGGHKTVFTRFFGHPTWSVLVRLSYGLYLVSPGFMMFVLSLDTKFHEFQVLELWMFIAGSVSISLLYSLAVWLLVDRPVARFTTWLQEVTGTTKRPQMK